MAPKYENVIVFGPTGAVGSSVAQEAGKRGAKVWLAMRDPSKSIGSIDEKSGQFERIKADLTDPESVKEAIQKSGATAAFIYVVFGPNPMDPTLKAMKEAGIEYVVFLSSFSISKGANMREIQPSEVIPFIHAKVEIALEDIGLAHAALRPASFATNTFKMSMDHSKSPAEIFIYGDGSRKMDNIVPLDIGRVGGAVLVDRPSDGPKEIIYLFGPELSTEGKSCEVIEKHYRKKVTVTSQTGDEWGDRMLKLGLPPPAVTYMKKELAAGHNDSFAWSLQPEGAANIKKYSGYEPTRFEDFVKSYDG